MILEVTKLLRYLFLIYVLNAVSIIFLEVHKLYMSCKLSGAIHSLYLSILRIHNSHYVMLGIKRVHSIIEETF